MTSLVFGKNGRKTFELRSGQRAAYRRSPRRRALIAAVDAGELDATSAGSKEAERPLRSWRKPPFLAEQGLILKEAISVERTVTGMRDGDGPCPELQSRFGGGSRKIKIVIMEIEPFVKTNTRIKQGAGLGSDKDTVQPVNSRRTRTEESDDPVSANGPRKMVAVSMSLLVDKPC